MTKYAAALLIAVATLAPQAQSLDPLTAEDTLKVATAQVLDLSEDGRLVAIGARRLYDNAETNHRRYGDPTYFAPTMVDVQVINTRTGAADKVGKGLMNVRQAAFTRDGARLALLTAAETAAGLPITSLSIYDVAKKTLVEVPRSKGAEVAANSELSWTSDGSKLLVALRDPAEDRTAQATFKKLIDGPVVVHTSKDAFLDWDALRRADRLRALAELDPRSGDARRVLPATRMTDYQPSRDGSFITFREDATEKTDYDVISGTQNHLKLIAAGQTSPRTLMAATDLKTTNPRWSDDGRLFAWADRGQVFVRGVDEQRGAGVVFRRTIQSRRDKDCAHQQEGLVHRFGGRRDTREGLFHRRQERGQEPARVGDGLDGGGRCPAGAVQRARSLGPRRDEPEPRDQDADAAGQGPQPVSERPLFP